MPIPRGSPSYRYKWEIPALIFSLGLMFYGTMWLFGLIGDIIIDSETDWMLTLEDFGATMLVGLFLFLGSIALVGWRAPCPAPPSAAFRDSRRRAPISRALCHQRGVP